MKQKELEFKVNEHQAGQRIDIYLSNLVPEASRSKISKLIEQKNIKVNRQDTSKNYKIKRGDQIIVHYAETGPAESIKPQNINIKVIYEDEHMLIISKPAGLPCHPGPGHGSHTLANALVYKFSRLSGFDKSQRPGIVHRLDKDTSGLMVIAKDDRFHELLIQLFKNRKIKKNYTALVQGIFAEKKGKIILPLGRSAKDRKKISVRLNGGRDAITKFSLIKEFDEGCSLLDISPETGRTHQIRVHLSHIGHPVVGDRKYGNKGSLKLAKKIGLKRQFLHAHKLEFEHPITRNIIKAEDKLPQDLQLGLDKLNQH